MTINLKRGLFRLWVVASTIWVVGSLYLSFLETNQLDREYEKYLEATYKEDATKKGVEFADAAIQKELSEAKIKNVRKETFLLYVSFKWTVLPPFAVLIIGWALTWAMSGFRDGTKLN